ncbi:unnamed protein product [Prorocentrum cordatum]|uniref:Guanine nucleotide-binding protein subunit beta-like protein n=1 Tax=Prorocentrum cordatum TaxID=2364126 RepID=A0ABN9S8U0_9DINO|nr:unnamed protein product [Polarella glacialis]
MPDGRSIVSGWSDGKIRAFLPQSGKLLYVINDAHKNGVTAIGVTSDCGRIVSGGMEGEVRVWNIGRQTQTMDVSLKEHRGRVWCIKVKSDNSAAVSASSDGSCIVWDLGTKTRRASACSRRRCSRAWCTTPTSRSCSPRAATARSGTGTPSMARPSACWRAPTRESLAHSPSRRLARTSCRAATTAC